MKEQRIRQLQEPEEEDDEEEEEESDESPNLSPRDTHDEKPP